MAVNCIASVYPFIDVWNLDPPITNLIPPEEYIKQRLTPDEQELAKSLYKQSRGKSLNVKENEIHRTLFDNRVRMNPELRRYRGVPSGYKEPPALQEFSSTLHDANCLDVLGEDNNLVCKIDLRGSIFILKLVCHIPFYAHPNSNINIVLEQV